MRADVPAEGNLGQNSGRWDDLWRTLHHFADAYNQSAHQPAVQDFVRGLVGGGERRVDTQGSV